MSTRPVISTTLITHNRISLTRRVLKAYLTSTQLPFELIIVDNASSDGTRDYLKRFVREHPQVNLILNDRNLPLGAAANIGFSKSSGHFLHKMDNDILHLPGWDHRILQCFELFPWLGQVSPLKVPKSYLTQVHAIDKDFALAYSVRNVAGGSNIIRRSIWDKGLRFREESYYAGGICEDYWFSQAISELGYEFAWFATDEYCINLGHNPHEMIKDIQYYINSYDERGNLSLLEQRIKSAGFDMSFFLRESTIDSLRKTSSRKRLRSLGNHIRLAWRDRINSKRFLHQHRPRRISKALRISAVIPTYNEEDVLYWIIHYLVSQNIRVHILDNQSTDATCKIVNKFPRTKVSLSRFETAGQFDERIQSKNIQGILHRLENESDWVIKNDADEFLEAPFHSLSLRRGIELADNLGFNSIGSRNFVFHPISDEQTHISGDDVRKYYNHFKVWNKVDRWPSEFHPLANELWKINVYKCREGVSYLDPHTIAPLQNVHLFPHLFILRHYPFRDPERTKRRLLTDRRDRMSKWNIENQVSCHYTKYTEEDTFIFDNMKEKMQKWSLFQKPKFERNRC